MSRQRDAEVLPKLERKRILFERSFHWLRKKLPAPPDPDWTVAEAGQGRYGWSSFYREHFSKVYGIDIEDYSGGRPEVISIQADLAESIPLPDEAVDLVVSHSVLEHVKDVPASLANLDRILKTGGYVFVTISPLYYSARGSHVSVPVKLANWEHLDPASPYYMLTNPSPEGKRSGTFLNQMTFSDFMGWVARQPWAVVASKLAIDDREIPSWVDRGRHSEMDLRTKGFFLLARKVWHCGRS